MFALLEDLMYVKLTYCISCIDKGAQAATGLIFSANGNYAIPMINSNLTLKTKTNLYLKCRLCYCEVELNSFPN